MRVLIAYGSERGGTAGLAAMIGDELSAHGFDTAVLPAGKAGKIAAGDFGAVLIAGALYAGRWHPDARRFARRNAEVLRQVPVWLVASGPLDGSAQARAIPPVSHVAQVMSLVGARGQVTFGGRLAADVKGFPAHAMARKHAGDWRDREHIRQWAATVAAELHRTGTAGLSHAGGAAR